MNYRFYRALVECPDVEVVDVCATTDLHHEITIAAARARRHVIVEKPLTGSDISEEVETKAGWRFPAPEED